MTSAGTPDNLNLNGLEREIRIFGHVYATRDGAGRLVIPTIAEYHLVTKPSAKLRKDLETIGSPNVRVDSSTWAVSLIVNVAKTGLFYLTQGNLLRLLRRYPSVQVPIVLAGAAATVMYYNLTMWGVALWVFGRIIDGCGMLSVWAVEQFGEPAWKFAFTISVHNAMMMGLKLFWMGFFKARSKMRSTCLRAVGANPNATLIVEREGTIPAPNDSADSSVLPVPVPQEKPPDSTPVVDAHQQIPSIIVSDTLSVDSTISPLGGNVPSSRRACQAHLLHYDQITWPAVALRPCNKKDRQDNPSAENRYLATRRSPRVVY